MGRVRALWLAIVLAVLLAGCTTVAPIGSLTTEEFMVPARDPGVELYVRNKYQSLQPGTPSFRLDRTVLFVHGATYPAHTSFDLRLDGMSWMDYIAIRGYDVYLLDVRGYGRSTRPHEMDAPAAQNEPLVTTEVAARDVAAVVDFILKRRGLDKLNLIGWSWGASIMALYTTQNNAKVNKLVLYAPQWVRTTASLVQVQGKLGAYRTVTMSSARDRWLTGVAENKKADLLPETWFKAWAEATQRSDAWGAAQNPPVIRAPNGVVFDSQRYWTQGKELYNPADIRVPVMLVKGEWDVDTPAYMAQALFPKLVNAPIKRYTELGEGTHTIMMERNRVELFRTVQAFLDEPVQRKR
jgi:pimeloyl-ACP methyl ester carboxylesterase